MAFVATRRSLLSRPKAAGGDTALAGWWNDGGAIAGCTVAYQAIGADDIAASQVNLARPGTYDLAPYVAGKYPTFNAATGWTGWAANTVWRVDELGVPATRTNTVFVRFTASATSGGQNRWAVFGAAANYQAGNWALILNWDYRDHLINGGFYRDYVPYRYGGVICANADNAFVDGVVEGQLGDGEISESIAGLPLIIGARYFNGILGASGANVVIQAFCVYHSTSLSSGDVATISSAMAALT